MKVLMTSLLLMMTMMLGVQPGVAQETDMQLAKDAVLARLPEAVIDYAVRERDDGRWMWSVFFTQGDLIGVCEVNEESNEMRRAQMYAMPEGGLTAAEAMAKLSEAKGALTVTALELDWDDGMLVYDGEAELDSARYEFEMTVTGELIEWERD